MYPSILDCVGKTPLVRLTNLGTNTCNIFVKLESKNPAGSIKDRIALHMVEKALENGDITFKSTLIEPTSGNTGIALAMIASLKGIHCIIIMPENMSLERQKIIKAYGAELILTPAKQGMAGATKVASEIQQQKPHAFMLNQFSNALAVQAHYLTTGPEIIADFTALGSQVHALVAGVGTGTTITGCALYLREKIADIRICAVEPQESPLLSQGSSGPHLIQGIGANFVPPLLQRELIDEIIPVRGEDALQMARDLFQKEGISCGISSGANVFAALQLAQQPSMQGKNIVTFICDAGERYLSTKLFEI